MKILAILATFLIAGSASAQILATRVTKNAILKSDGFSLEITNNEKETVRCEGVYEVKFTDSETGFDIMIKSFEFNSIIIEASKKLTENFSLTIPNVKASATTLSYVDFKCFSGVTDKELIEEIKKHIRNEKLAEAERIYSSLSDKQSFKYIDFSNSQFDPAYDLEEVKKMLKLNHINVNATPYQQRQFQSEANRMCDTRRNALCGLKFFEKVSPSCKPLYAEKSDPKCGIIYNSGRDEKCGCEERYDGICGSGCPCDKWNKCQLPKFGIKGYSTCVDPSFGIRGYEKCRNEAHGIEDAKKCDLEVNENDELKTCGTDEEIDDILNGSKL